MSDVLPEDMCYEILLRVPAEPLFRFKSVCKAWYCIINDTAFVKRHVHRHHQQECGDHVLIRSETGKLYSLHLSSLDCSTKSKSIKLTNIKNLVGLGVPKIKRLHVPSYSGVILITKKFGDEKSKTWMLWNPFTRESFVIPSHNHVMNGDDIYEEIPRSGIGYDFTTGDFKVVRILQLWGPQNTCMLETLIYSLKSNTWKRIINFHGCWQPLSSVDGVFVNGALHWMTHRYASRCIIAFDLSTEEDRVLPFPSFILPEYSLYGFHLNVLGGYLCLRNHHGVWIMTDYGGNVWTKLVSFVQLPDMGEPIAYIKRKGQLLFQQHGNNFVLFDVENKSAKKFSIEGFPIFTSQVIPSSLFRLNRSAGADGGVDGCIASKRTLKRKRKTTRLNVELKFSDV